MRRYRRKRQRARAFLGEAKGNARIGESTGPRVVKASVIEHHRRRGIRRELRNRVNRNAFRHAERTAREDHRVRESRRRTDDVRKNIKKE